MKTDRADYCKIKIRYATRNAARLAIQGMVTRPERRKRQHNLHSYPCRLCGGFHITGA